MVTKFLRINIDRSSLVTGLSPRVFATKQRGRIEMTVKDKPRRYSPRALTEQRGEREESSLLLSFTIPYHTEQSLLIDGVNG